MDGWIQTVANIGGVGAMAVMLYFLHRDSIKTFAEQLQQERDVFRAEMAATRADNQSLWRTYMDLKIRHHEQVVAGLLAQDKLLSEIKDKLERERRSSG